MKSIFVSAALIAAADALIARDSTCCFHLTASGGPGGVVGQLSDGQNRIGQTSGLANGQGTYCIDSKGGLTDGNGRGCILTPPTTQFQCDVGASPTDGFSVSCDGALSYKGNTDFKACPTGDNGGYNIYTVAPAGQGGCVSITLGADNCKSGCPAPAPAPKTCPAALSGAYEYPHLIIPVDSKQPDKAFGTQYNGTVSNTVSSLFNFDIPSSDSGKTCSLVFLFPEQKNLETSSFDFSGAGGIDFAMLKGPASSSTTYNNKPGVATDYGVTKVAPGTSSVIATFPCPGNSAIGFSLSASDNTQLSFFEDYNPSAIGLYITVC